MYPLHGRIPWLCFVKKIKSDLACKFLMIFLRTCFRWPTKSYWWCFLIGWILLHSTGENILNKSCLKKQQMFQKSLDFTYILFLLLFHAGKEMTGAPSTGVEYITTQKNRRCHSLKWFNSSFPLCRLSLKTSSRRHRPSTRTRLWLRWIYFACFKHPLYFFILVNTICLNVHFKHGSYTLSLGEGG